VVSGRGVVVGEEQGGGIEEQVEEEGREGVCVEACA